MTWLSNIEKELRRLRPMRESFTSKKSIARERMRRQMFIEQKGLCWLCEGAMSMDRRPMAEFATFDHVRPQSKGGTWARANLKLAHSRCNGARGNSTDFWLASPDS